MSEDLFELRRELPNEYLNAQAARLIGFEARFERLRGQMRLLSDAHGLAEWARRFHGGASQLLSALSDRYPLVIFHGDVGTGKTATAEAAADRLARELDRDGFLLKLSTRVRGTGHVGEMSDLINRAFDEARSLAGKERFVTLVVDEGDAIAFHRARERAHHEDKVGVNTLIQKIDEARELSGRLLVILCTNRFESIDPAVVRRATLREEFTRPSDRERRELFEHDLGELAMLATSIDELVELTGQRDGQPGFTFSDIRTRLLPLAIARVFPARALEARDLLIVADELEPTPVMRDGGD